MRRYLLALALLCSCAATEAQHRKFGYTPVPAGSGGGGTVTTDGVTIDGDGSSGSPLSGIPSSASNAGTMSAADKQYINARDWSQAMFAFAVKQYPTINRGFVVPFAQGSGVDYQSGGVNGSGTLTLSSTIEEDVTLATGTSGSSGIGVVGKNNPIVMTAVTTQPWLVAIRCKNTTAVDNTTLSVIDPTNTGTPFTTTRPLFGIVGASSTSFYTFQASASTKLVTSVAIDNTVFHDFAMGYNGSTTLTAYFGDAVAGTLASVATSTDLTDLGAGTGQPAALLFTTTTTNRTFDCTRLGAWTTQP